jgi:hypothetical protein
MARTTLRRALVTALLVVGFWVGLYVHGMHIEPYRTSTRFIRNNGVILRELGDVKSMRLSLFGYRYSYSGTSGSAEYALHVVGTKGTGTVYLNLQKAVGLWRVEDGNLVLKNGEAVRLSAGP